MWRKLLGLSLLLLLLVGLGWWSQRPRSVVAAPCVGVPVLLTYQGREALWCLDRATPVALIEAAEVTGACREAMLALPSLKPAEHLRATEEGGGCVVARAPMPASQRFVLGVALDLNEATQEDLEALPGVGPSVARAIVEDREKNGLFQSVDELDRVKGIGPKALARLRPFLSVDK